MQKTFIHHDGALGDLLLSLPAITFIRQNTGFVHLAGRADAAALLLETGMVDASSDVGGSRYASLYGDCPDQSLRDFLSGFDSSVIFTAKVDSPAASSLALLISATRVIKTIPDDGTRIHVSEYRFRQLAGEAATPLPDIILPERVRENAKEFLTRSGYDFVRPLISVHPGSGGRRKCWPLDNYFSLLAMLPRLNDPFIILFSGPAENVTITSLLERYQTKNRTRSAHVISSDLASVAALISLSDLYIGNDSGISHLAACVGTASIVLFGPTDPALWEPRGRKVGVVRSGLDCSPCGDDLSRKCRPPGCLDEISPLTVFDVIKDTMQLGINSKLQSK